MGIESDFSSAMEALQSLSGKEQIRIKKGALLVGAKGIEKKVKENTQTIFKNKSVKYAHIYNSIRAKVDKNGAVSKVHLMGNLRYYHSYILRFFSIGTTERFTKKYAGKTLSKQRSTGYIQKKDFFAGINENEIYSKVEKNISKKVDKLFNKK